MKKVYQVEYAGHLIRYSFMFPGTMYNFRNYIRPAEGDQYDIRVTPELVEIGKELLPEDSSDAYVEYRLMIERTALELLRWDCCIFHSAAFVFEGRAWLLAAPSGTGKTTQFLNWQRLHPGEIRMICGDMPVLEPRPDGSIRVHSTSWCGKETIGSRELTAPLSGVILLEQGSENTIGPMQPADAILPFFEQFIVRPETEAQILALSRLMDRLLEFPVYKFVNLGDDGSTELLRECIMRFNGAKGGCDGSL
ncbi:MAG: hypothetical protein IJM18_09640 [Clostridia bacterium]|nr:hypothetical protein [Clostridia bacterium]